MTAGEASNVVLLFGLLFVLFLLVLSTVVLLRFMERRRSEDRKVRAELSLMREYLDKRLEEVNKAVSESYDLWTDTSRLLVEGQSSSTPFTESGEDFLSRLGIRREAVGLRQGQAAVLMPITRTHDPVLRAIDRACKSVGYSAIRSDREFVQGNLLRHIVLLVLESELVICDVSSRNPNVFYELGLAHAYNKPVLLISQQLDDQAHPYDIQFNRIILYRDTYDLEEKLKSAIVGMVQAVAGSVKGY